MLNLCVLLYQKALEWKKEIVLVNRNVIAQGGCNKCNLLFRFCYSLLYWFIYVMIYLTAIG
jgi:hypothetical protein